MNDEQLIAERFPHHHDPEQMVITRGVRGGEVVKRLACQRIRVDGKGRWVSQHIGGGIAQASDGQLYATLIAPRVILTSVNDGQTWTEIQVQDDNGKLQNVPFSILNDDTFVALWGDGSGLGCWTSTDRGLHWKQIGCVTKGVFDVVYGDSNLLQLADGSLLGAGSYQLEMPTDESPYEARNDCQYMLRSTDGGATWSQTPDMKFWGAIKDCRFMVRGQSQASTNPGPGGSFPGCYETNLIQLPDGTVMAALRYSGFPQPWHDSVSVPWGAAAEPDDHGRTYRHIMLGHSTDNGATWQDLRPVADETGHTVLTYGDCNGELVQMPDGRLVLIFQRRYPREYAMHMAIVSENNGRTWLPHEYHVMAGFGYSGSYVLSDSTIITVNGKAVLNEAGRCENSPHDAEIIRWRLD